MIGDRAVLAGQAGVAGHLEIGAGTVICAQAGIIGNVPENATIFGTPGIAKARFLRAFAHFKRLPDTETRIRALEQQVEELSRSPRPEIVWHPRPSIQPEEATPEQVGGPQ